MDDPRFVLCLQSLGELMRNRQRFVDRDRAVCDAVGERGSFNQLQGERAGAIGFVFFFRAVDLRDAKVVEAGENLRLPLESREAIGVSREGVRKDLQGDIAAQLRVGGPIHLAHAPLADEGGHVVMAEAGADGQGHAWNRFARFGDIKSRARDDAPVSREVRGHR